MASKAVGRYLRFSAHKGRMVADMVRGRGVEEALNILKFTRKNAATHIRKIMDSALANANKDGSVNVDRLVVKLITVDEGPTMRRFMTRSMGRAYRIRKRSCHVTVVLDER